MRALLLQGQGQVMSIYAVLFIVFVVLKLCGLIEWSWWWISAPAWGSAALYAVVQLLNLIPRRNKTSNTPSEHNL